MCFGDGLYEIDAQSGQIVGARAGSDEGLIDFVRLSSNCAYDKELNMYVYTGLGTSGALFSSSVCNGMFTNSAVTLASDPTTQLKVFLNGELLEYSGEGEFGDPGTYIVRDRDNSLVLNFTVLPELTNAVNFYDIPEIFFIDSVLLDGEPVSPQGNRVYMDKDGEYSINYFCYETGVKYFLDVVVDHTAPVLEYSGIGKDGYAHGAVVLGDIERNSSVSVTLDGEKIPFTQTLTAAGDYEIHYADAAGNTNTYNITIRPYLDINAWMAVLIVVLLVIGIAAFMIYTRTHMRVR